jgi:hypothetical protein
MDTSGNCFGYVTESTTDPSALNNPTCSPSLSRQKTA